MAQDIVQYHDEPDLFAGALAHLAPPPDAADNPEDDNKAGHAFKTISEVAAMLELPQHVLRFWESKFTQIRPLKMKGGRRYYRPQDIETLFMVKRLLYKEGYTIKGARKAILNARKQHEELMAPSGNKKRDKVARVEDTPLFQSLKPAVAAASPVASALLKQAAAPQLLPAVATVPVEVQPAAANTDDSKRNELRAIQQELLQLRDLVKSLPPLSA